MDDNDRGAEDTEKTANLTVKVQLLVQQCGGEDSTVSGVCVYVCVCVLDVSDKCLPRYNIIIMVILSLIYAHMYNVLHSTSSRKYYNPVHNVHVCIPNTQPFTF